MSLQKKIVNVETMNELLSKLTFTSIINEVYKAGETKDSILLRMFYWSDNRNNPNFVFRIAPNYPPIHYVVKADEEEIKKTQDRIGIGSKALKELKMLLKKNSEDIEQTVITQKHDEESGRPFYSYEAYVDCNPVKSGYAEHCVQLDMNSCYLYFMQKPLPDQFVGYDRIVEPGQLGFNELVTRNFTIALQLATPGQHAKYVFTTKVYKSLVEYTNSKFNLLSQLERGSDERNLEKAKTHALLGSLVWKNPFICAAVVGYATNYIKSWQNPDYWVSSTVDSLIFTDNYIPEGIPIGEGLGQFKIEYEDFTLVSHSVGAKHYIFSDGATLDKVRGLSNAVHNLSFDPIDKQVYNLGGYIDE